MFPQQIRTEFSLIRKFGYTPSDSIPEAREANGESGQKFRIYEAHPSAWKVKRPFDLDSSQGEESRPAGLLTSASSWVWGLGV